VNVNPRAEWLGGFCLWIFIIKDYD